MTKFDPQNFLRADAVVRSDISSDFAAEERIRESYKLFVFKLSLQLRAISRTLRTRLEQRIQERQSKRASKISNVNAQC